MLPALRCLQGYGSLIVGSESTGSNQVAQAKDLTRMPTAHPYHCPPCCTRATSCSLAQAAAAGQAGASLVTANVGRVRDWYTKHPGYIRDPQVSLRGLHQTAWRGEPVC
jgi:hypothetical protein